MTLEEQRLTVLHILRDTLIEYEKGNVTAGAVEAIVDILNRIEKEVGIETKNANYYLNLFQLKEGF